MEVTLNNGLKMPMTVFGTYAIANVDVKPALENAVRIGFRHLDCAAIYNNEASVGIALEEIIGSGSVNREELYITTKV